MSLGIARMVYSTRLANTHFSRDGQACTAARIQPSKTSASWRAFAYVAFCPSLQVQNLHNATMFAFSLVLKQPLPRILMLFAPRRATCPGTSPCLCAPRHQPPSAHSPSCQFCVEHSCECLHLQVPMTNGQLRSSMPNISPSPLFHYSLILHPGDTLSLEPAVALQVLQIVVNSKCALRQPLRHSYLPQFFSYLPRNTSARPRPPRAANH
jgi:hypothetical protein